MFAENMGVNLRRTYVIVAQQFLNRSNISTCGQHVRCERVPKGMARDAFANDARFSYCLFKEFSGNRFVQVVATKLARHRVVA